VTQLVLSLFPGIGLLDMAFEEEGFCVVRGPDLLWGGDIRRFHPPAGRFDGVIGGPPCQAFSRLRHIVAANGHKVADNLIPEYERVVREAAPRWFLMENVPDAPEPICDDYRLMSQLVNNRHCGGEQNRVRRFTFGARDDVAAAPFHVVGEALEPAASAPAVLASSGGRAVPVAIGGSGKRKHGGGIPMRRSVSGLPEAIRLQGLPADFLSDCPLTADGKMRAVGNGVPLPLGRAVARAVKAALGLTT
jgi:DNA (cytosine-5)-methyltransferase 1